MRTTGYLYDTMPIWMKQSIKRDENMYSRYGIHSDEYDAMLLIQDNKCKVCGDVFEGNKHTHVDHDHYTGEVRSLLCRGCNQGIGNFKEDIRTLENAIQYLRDYE